MIFSSYVARAGSNTGTFLLGKAAVRSSVAWATTVSTSRKALSEVILPRGAPSSDRLRTPRWEECR